jgi:hypothetical protein
MSQDSLSIPQILIERLLCKVYAVESGMVIAKPNLVY